MTGEWESPRAKKARELREETEAFDALLDAGMSLEEIAAIRRELGAVSVVATYPASVYQQQAINRLEREMPEGGDV